MVERSQWGDTRHEKKITEEPVSFSRQPLRATSIAPSLPCNNHHLLLVLGLGPVPVPVVFHCPWPHLSSNSHKPSMHLPNPTGTSKWIQTWTHTEALDFSGFLPMG